jgi:hypothetical protein
MSTRTPPVPSDSSPQSATVERHDRVAERFDVTLPARLTWKDQRGMTRFASVVTKNVSEFGLFVESQSPVSLPLYRLVHVQLERDCRDTKQVPVALRDGRVLAAVYRVAPPTFSGGRHGLALRLMVDPKRAAMSDLAVEKTRATA